jgi:hypothetical protein
MSYKLPFKKSEVPVQYITVTDEVGNELTLPAKPFSYKDQQWVKANSTILEDSAQGEEATYLMAEYHLRSRLEIPDEVTRDELFRYEDGSPFSMVFVVALAEAFGKQVLNVQGELEKLKNEKEVSENKYQPKRSTKTSRKSVQKNG